MDLLTRIEERFDFYKAEAFIAKYWHYSIYISAFYVVTIFAIQRWMRDREKYDLRRPLFLWSLTLTVFSMAGFVVAGWPHFLYFIHHGWERSICDLTIKFGRPGLWSFLFCFSKLPELTDTYFIVLRKQKLIFLHWYHHITVFMYCWYSYCHIINANQWFIAMNYFVHSFMYLYFAVRASGRFRPPLWVNMFITSLQLLQMIVGVYVNWVAYSRMKADPTWYCDGQTESSYFYVFLAFALYFSYFVLFAHFFYTSYLHKERNTKAEHVNIHLAQTKTFIDTQSKPQRSGTCLPQANGKGLLLSNGTLNVIK